MVITDSYHNDIEGKDYKYGSPTMIDNKSKPIILYYFLDDYERVWDEGKPIKYDDEELKNNASVSQIDYTDNVLLITLFDYETFDETSLKFEVGKETSIPDVVDENNHSKEYRFTPTKIVVANSLGKDSAVYDEIVTSVWDGYYKTASKEGEKLPKVAENVKNAESYKKCAECSDSVFGLEEEICFECSSFGAESEDCEVCYTTVDKGTLNDVQAGRICNECHKMNQYTGGTRTIKTPYNAETFDADVKMDENAFVVVSVLIKQHRPISREYLHDILITKEDAKKTSPLKLIKEYIDSEAEYSTSSDLDVPEYWIFERNALAQIKSTRQMMAETYEAQGKPTWAGYCPFCKKWRTTEWSKQDGKDRLCGKRVPDYHTEAGEWAYFYREKFARHGGNWAEPNENICGVVLEKKQSKNAESFNADVKMDNRAWVAYYEYDFANVRPENPENITGDSKMVSFRDYRKELYGIYLTTQEAKKAFNLLKGSLMGHGDWKDGQYKQVINGYKQIYGGTSLKKTIPMQMKFEYVPIRRFGYDTAMHTKSKNAETFESESDCREAKEEVKKLRRKIALLDKLYDKENALHHEILGSGGFFKEHELKGLFSEKDLENYEYWS